MKFNTSYPNSKASIIWIDIGLTAMATVGPPLASAVSLSFWLLCSSLSCRAPLFSHLDSLPKAPELVLNRVQQHLTSVTVRGGCENSDKEDAERTTTACDPSPGDARAGDGAKLPGNSDRWRQVSRNSLLRWPGEPVLQQCRTSALALCAFCQKNALL